MELDLATVTEALAAADPDRECLVAGGRSFTRAEVAERTRCLADVLVRHGLGISQEPVGNRQWESPHDHVALYLHNGAEYLEGMLGAWKARCSAFNVNYRYVGAELEYLLNDANTAAIIVHDTFVPTLAEVLPRLRRQPEVILQVRDGSPHNLLPGAMEYEAALKSASPELAPDLVQSWSGDDLYLCYTGGTTGMPKGTMWRQADFIVAALGVRHGDGTEYASLEELLGAARPGLRALPAPPLMHGAAHWNALSSWVAGGSVVIQDVVDRFDATDILDTIETHRVSSVLVVGDPMARPLLDTLAAEREAGRVRDLSSLRHLLSGGAVLSAQTKRALMEAVPGLVIVDVLGSTESGRQGLARSRDASDADVGFSPSPTAVVLSDSLDRRLGPGDTEIGWLAQAGRVPLGYLGDADKTRATFPTVDGVRYSVPGDRARLDADGRIELLGRDSVCINTGGEKVFAEEVEVALTGHPAVFDAVVCGRPSARWGEEVIAIVSLRDDAEATDEELVEFVGQTLARYKLPKQIVRVDSVVRSPSGKADYRWARDTAVGAASAGTTSTSAGATSTS